MGKKRQRRNVNELFNSFLYVAGAHKDQYDFSDDEWSKIKRIYGQLDPTSKTLHVKSNRIDYDRTADLGRRRAAIRGLYQLKANKIREGEIAKDNLGAPGTRQNKQSKVPRRKMVRRQAGAPKSITFTGRYTPQNRQSLKISGGIN